jgi:hypothetical protein
VSDDANPPVPAAPSPRRRRPRLRVYFETWLLSAFLVYSCSILWLVNDAAEKKREVQGIGGATIMAPVLALLSLPTLWLLRIFRETSPSTVLRCLRRLVLGGACGLFPSAILVAINAARRSTEHENLGVLWASGLTFGLVAGFVDAMHLDAARDEPG